MMANLFDSSPPISNEVMLSLPNRTSISDFAVETLESRHLLAGIVVASLNANGNLIISGDGLSNSIDLTTNLDGDIVISGSSGTEIEFGGTLSTNHTISLSEVGMLRDVRIRLKGGDDTLTINDLDVSGQLNVNLASGNDQLQASMVNVTSQVIVSCGGGSDQVDLQLMDATGALHVNLGRAGSVGSDALVVNLFSSGQSSTIRGGSGATDVSIISSQFTGNVKFNLGSGDDTLDLLDTSATQMTANLGRGDDQVFCNLLDVGESMNLQLAGGDDTLTFSGPCSVGGDYTLNGNSGDDSTFFLFLNTVTGESRISSVESVI